MPQPLVWLLAHCGDLGGRGGQITVNAVVMSTRSASVTTVANVVIALALLPILLLSATTLLLLVPIKGKGRSPQLSPTVPSAVVACDTAVVVAVARLLASISR